MKKDNAGQKETLKKVLQVIGKQKILLVFSLLLSLLTVAGSLYVPILSGYAIDLMVGEGQVVFDRILPFLLQIGITIVGIALAQWLMNLCNNRLAFQTVRSLREQAFRHIQTLPLKYLDTHPTGDIVSRMITDAEQLADGLLIGFTQLFTGILTILGTLFFMFRVNGLIAGAVVVITPLSLVAAAFIAKKSYRYFTAQSAIRGSQTAYIDEMVSNQKVVRAFGQEAQTQQHFDELNEELRSCSLKATFFSSLTNPTTRFVNSIVYACVGIAGALVLINDGTAALTVGSLTALLSYASQYTKPFNEISGVITELQGALACARRLFDLMEEPSESAEAPKELQTPDGRVELKDLYFSYSREHPLIRGLNLKVKPGQNIAIVGPTGCGKTTLINLLMRFYDVDSGSISVSGECVMNVSRSSLRSAYGMVLQDTWLKSGTIRENILMGKEDATDEEVLAAAKATHAHSFIKRLPKGYDTVIAEDGGNLSQGQKQLLCITRVMLALPPMLILDEATSSIDTRTEMRIQRAFSALMQGRTSFIVAHRLSTIQNADTILVMNNGNVVEQGTHEELLQKKGFYAKLYESQFAKVG